MKRAIIVGATSGIGQEIAKVLLAQGWKIGIAGRRKELLTAFQTRETQALDVTQKDAVLKLNGLIEQLGGMDLFLLCSGIGKQNRDLQPEIEIDTARTNVGGFIRMTNAAYTYFRQQGGGHLAVISSIAGTKGLGVAPAYSATKRFQNIYIDSLEQLAYMQKLKIRFTDIKPGFVDTALLDSSEKTYPLLMKPEKVAKIAVNALNKKRRSVIIDWRYAILTIMWRGIPSCLWKRLPVKN